METLSRNASKLRSIHRCMSADKLVLSMEEEQVDPMDPASSHSGISLFPEPGQEIWFTQQLPLIPPSSRRPSGLPTSILFSGSKFSGHQKSRGNCYDVEVSSPRWAANTIVHDSRSARV